MQPATICHKETSGMPPHWQGSNPSKPKQNRSDSLSSAKLLILSVCGLLYCNKDLKIWNFGRLFCYKNESKVHFRRFHRTKKVYCPYPERLCTGLAKHLHRSPRHSTRELRPALQPQQKDLFPPWFITIIPKLTIWKIIIKSKKNHTLYI